MRAGLCALDVKGSGHVFSERMRAVRHKCRVVPLIRHKCSLTAINGAADGSPFHDACARDP
jgi:hypothetical protein